MAAFRELRNGFIDSLVLAWAVVSVVFGGFFRAMGRITHAFIRHEPLPVAPGKSYRLT